MSESSGMAIRFDEGPVAVLYQEVPPPVVGGIRKPKKPGGYSDSGADIAYALSKAGVPVATPCKEPDPREAMAWVFPDTLEGIRCAIDIGARTLWANTVLFRGHPIQEAAEQGFGIVGQEPGRVHVHDDKAVTNALIARNDCRVPASILVSVGFESKGVAIDAVSNQGLADHGLSFPLVLKPIRGRGSEGVTRVESIESLRRAASELFGSTIEVDGKNTQKYGNQLILEEYLPGDELTLTVMPPGQYSIGGMTTSFENYWPLPAVARFNHLGGIAPYNGVVAVTRNSRVLTEVEDTDPALARLLPQVKRAARLVGARAPIRVDCRRAEDGEFRLFDLNMKPNMTGAGRPGRDTQDSLSLIAARKIGWRFEDLLINMLHQAWNGDGGQSV
jgi:hypothetical protein